jgi:hypothetical protein
MEVGAATTSANNLALQLSRFRLWYMYSTVNATVDHIR